MSVGYLAAPLLGGLVYEKSGYYSVFYMAFGLLFLDIILRLALIEKKIARQWVEVQRSDTESNSRSTPEHFRRSKSEESPKPEPSAQVAGPVESGEAHINTSFAPSVRGQTSLQSRWPPIFTLLKSPRVLTALWGVAVQSSLMTALDSVVPLFVARTFHWNAIGAGLVFLAVIVPSFLSPLIGLVADRYGARWLIVVGFIFATPFWILLRLVTHDTLKQKVFFCALMSLIGVSLALVLPPLMAEISYIIDAKEKQCPGCFGPSGAFAQAYGLLIAAFAAGTLIGPLWGGYVEDAAGWATMALSLGLFGLAGALPCLIYTGGCIWSRNAKTWEERALGVPASAIAVEVNNV